MRRFCAAVALLSSVMFCAALPAQILDPLAPKTSPAQSTNPLTDPGVTPGIQFLYDLEGRFAADTAKGGGRAFAAWFAPDAVTLSNGEAPVTGRDAIAVAATWSPDKYQLTWTPEGARMGTSGDMGFTWGHYEGVSKDKDGNTVRTSGRYMTVWKKQPDGTWKVELDASNDGPKADCCSLH
jgi:ketosteroid isomerase-like protein